VLKLHILPPERVVYLKTTFFFIERWLIHVVVRSKACVYGHLIAGIAGSNRTGGLVCVVCCAAGRSLVQGSPCRMCVCVCNQTQQ
jgi:hypothetical protein